MPSQTKAELIAVNKREFAKLRKTVEGVPPDIALVKDADDTSIKDIVAHRAHWIDLFLGWYADGQAGKDVAFPAPGYKWNELKRYNADLRARQADLTWDAARDMLSDRAAALSEFISARSEEDLYGGPMKGAKNKWTPGRWAEAAGPSHYRSATKYIRSRLKELTAPSA
ncbi:MAG: ClbS/DfsB family four-helix bundle protein [Pseudomonadota bacterium]